MQMLPRLLLTYYVSRQFPAGFRPPEGAAFFCFARGKRRVGLQRAVTINTITWHGGG